MTLRKSDIEAEQTIQMVTRFLRVADARFSSLISQPLAGEEGDLVAVLVLRIPTGVAPDSLAIAGPPQYSPELDMRTSGSDSPRSDEQRPGDNPYRSSNTDNQMDRLMQAVLDEARRA